MPVVIRIPTPLQEFTQQKDTVEVEGSTVKEVLAQLDQRHSGIRQRLYDENGKLRRLTEMLGALVI